MDIPLPGRLPGTLPGAIPRSRLWSVALWTALVLAWGWLLLPGVCVVLPAGTSESLLARSVLLSILRPFRKDWEYPLEVLFAFGPLILVLLAMAHWRRMTWLVRSFSVVFALLFSAMFAFHPARRMMDLMLMGVVGFWALILLVGFRSKASPGSALVALLALQLGTTAFFVGLGPYRGIPYWCLLGCLGIVFVYGLLHYTRKLRHRILGRFTVIQRRRPSMVDHRRALAGDQWRV
jgi:hypothetical protein